MLTNSANFPELKQHRLMRIGNFDLSYKFCLGKHIVFLPYPPQVTGCYASFYYFICKLLKQQVAIMSTTIKLIIKSN